LYHSAFDVAGIDCMDDNKIRSMVNAAWDESIIPTLCEYIKIPNKSPMFDRDWEAHGYMEQAVAMLESWCRKQPIKDMTIEVVRLPGRTPLLLIDVPGSSDKAEDVVLFYGHYDKQPEFSGWDADLDPWTPVIKNGKLYGRGGADDGYAIFASLTAIRALQERGMPHAHCVVLIEGCEESGSFDLPFYIDHLGEKLGNPSLVIGLDAECGDYEHFWCTTSLRGVLNGTLRADVLTEGVHSGSAGGIVPSCFRVLRRMLSRIEDQNTGKILLDELNVDIPEERKQQARMAAEVLGDSVYRKFPWIDGNPTPDESMYDLLLNNNWRPTLAVIGVDGIPDFADAGATLLPSASLKLSIRLPPTVNAEIASRAVKAACEADPPSFARVSFETDITMMGWHAPPVSKWLATSMDRASREFFGEPSVYMGTGGTIPFMGMLGEKFPAALFLVTGLLGPKSNAHGPNEFLHIEKAKKLTCCVARVLADHLRRK
jgi:acetylornithine deacetylase/succinyl-diaminopimelate desuccinylase-like protein